METPAGKPCDFFRILLYKSPEPANFSLNAMLGDVRLHLGPKNNPIAYGALTVNQNSAITLWGREIYYRPDKFPAVPFDKLNLKTPTHRKDLALLVHESLHILQQQQTTSQYLWKLHYLSESADKGYEGIEAEIEAYSLQYAVDKLLEAHPHAFSQPLADSEISLLRRTYEQRLQLEKASVNSKSGTLIRGIMNLPERIPLPGIGGDAFP